MLRAAPGVREMRPAFSKVITIWWTDGAVTSKWRRMSASAGGPFEYPAIGVDEGQVLALGLRKAGSRRRCAFVK